MSKYDLTGDDRRYDNLHDASMRLYKTIVRFDGRPVFIKRVEAEPAQCRLWFLDRPEDPEIWVSANDKRLDISSFPLGYVNCNGSAVYLKRRPIRSQRQGIDPGRVWANVPNGSQIPEFLCSNPALRALGTAYTGEFLSIAQAGQASSGAFARHWALSMTRDQAVRLVFHRLFAVGFFVPKEKRFIMNADLYNPVSQKVFERTLASQKENYYVTTCS